MTRWIRFPNPEYDFFIPDTNFRYYRNHEYSYGTRDSGSDTDSDADSDSDVDSDEDTTDARWMREVFQRGPEGERLMSSYFRQVRAFDRLNGQGEDVVSSVSGLLDRANISLVHRKK